VWQRQHGRRDYSLAFAFDRYNTSGVFVGSQTVTAALELGRSGDEFTSKIWDRNFRCQRHPDRHRLRHGRGEAVRMTITSRIERRQAECLQHALLLLSPSRLSQSGASLSAGSRVDGHGNNMAAANRDGAGTRRDSLEACGPGVCHVVARPLDGFNAILGLLRSASVRSATFKTLVESDERDEHDRVRRTRHLRLRTLQSVHTPHDRHRGCQSTDQDPRRSSEGVARTTWL